MNEIFNFKRFGRMLAVDFNRIVREYGLTFILLCFTEVFVFAVASIVMLITDGTLASMDCNIRIVIFFVAFFILVLTMPQKCYGRITDKSKGSAYLAIPASTLEKFISMILFMILIGPVLFSAISWCADSALCHLFPDQFSDMIGADKIPAKPIGAALNSTCLIFITPMPWWLLGALWFRKGKGAKTLLCILAFALIVVLVGPFSHVGIEIENGVVVEESRNWVSEILTVAIDAALLFLAYLRIRKIQH